MSDIGKLILSACYVGKFNHLLIGRNQVFDAAKKIGMPAYAAFWYTESIGISIVE